MLDKLSIIYCTCDNYESLWNNFFLLWNKYWPNCKNKIILNTETKSIDFKGLNICRPKFDNTNCTWSQRLINSLNSIETEYALLVLDDFYIKSPINLEKLEDCIKRMEKNKNIKLFTFGWQPGPNIDEDKTYDFEKRGRFTRYRINAQIGLWRVSYLKKILKSFENPWQFEINGSFRSSIIGGDIYSLKKEAPLVFDYDWGFLIIRGKLNENIAKYFREKENLDMNLPFLPFTKEEHTENKGIRSFKMLKYSIEMLASLFRK